MHSIKTFIIFDVVLLSLRTVKVVIPLLSLLAGYYGIQEILRRKLETPQELEKKIRAITAKDIQKLARQIFKNERLNLVIVGKAPEQQKIVKMLKI